MDQYYLEVSITFVIIIIIIKEKANKIFKLLQGFFIFFFIIIIIIICQFYFVWLSWILYIQTCIHILRGEGVEHAIMPSSSSSSSSLLSILHLNPSFFFFDKNIQLYSPTSVRMNIILSGIQNIACNNNNILNHKQTFLFNLYHLLINLKIPSSWILSDVVF